MIIAGVDEAGRGPALGPMVLAVAVIEKSREEELLEIGVRDSKLLTPEQRQEQHPKLMKTLKEHGSAKVSAAEIDELRKRWSLNEIEAMRIGELLNRLKARPEAVYVDSPDPIASNFAHRIRKYLSFDTLIVSEHKADLNYPIVASASIIAKQERDAEIEKLTSRFGPMGSGYSHDPETVKFIKDYLQKNNKLPDFARKSWLTNQRIVDEKYQQKLF